MKGSRKPDSKGLTRREALKLSGLALGGLVIGGAGLNAEAGKALADCACPDGPTCSWTDNANLTQQYTYFERLAPFYPFCSSTKTTIRPLGTNEMRITFMGSSIPPDIRRKQAMMSIFVEVGWDKNKQMPLDQFVFDCGAGVVTNYAAMNVGFGRMNKVFINHLHGDHMNDLTHIYCFGPAADRKSPLYVFGPGNSNVESPPGSGKYYDDGTRAYCENLRRAMRWHTESFSFQSTSYPGYPTPKQIKKKWGLPCVPYPVEDDADDDAYAMVPIELDWQKVGGVAYNNIETGVKITHFPVIHCRQGSIGYKLEWRGLSMIYTSDTKPEYLSVRQARNGGEGVDVFIHEMIVPAQVWSMKLQHSTTLPDPNSAAVKWAAMVQNSSHSPQGAFGHLLSLIKPRPRLTVATHFPTSNDTVACALKSVKAHCPWVEFDSWNHGGNPQGNFAWSFDHMVLRVTKNNITQLRGVTSDFEWTPTVNLPSGTPNIPKYHDDEGNGDPYAQIDTSTAIPACEDGKCNYRTDGY